MEILRRSGVGLAHNPESNMKLASGVARGAGLDRTGRFARGSGTDGAASNNDLDMFEAMRTAALLHKVSIGQPAGAAGARRRSNWRRAAAPKRSAWAIASAASKSGKQADLITVSVAARGRRRCSIPISHLVYVARGDDVRTTVVAGRVLMAGAARAYAATAMHVLRDAREMADRVREARAGTAPARQRRPDP